MIPSIRTIVWVRTSHWPGSEVDISEQNTESVSIHPEKVEILFKSLIGINKIFEFSAEDRNRCDYITVTTAKIVQELKVHVILFYDLRIVCWFTYFEELLQRRLASFVSSITLNEHIYHRIQPSRLEHDIVKIVKNAHQIILLQNDWYDNVYVCLSVI